MQALAQQVFYGLLVELVIVILTVWFKDNPKASISILAVGTLIAAGIAFLPFPTLWQPSAAEQPVSVPVEVTEAPVEYTLNTPLTFTPCATSLACPDAMRIFNAIGEPDPYDYNMEFAVAVAQDLMVRFSTGWCTKEQQLLYDELPHIQYVFAIDGISHLDALDTQYDVSTLPEDPNTSSYCYLAGVGVSNWQPGVTYRITFGFIMDSDLFDGWENFTKGDYLRTFLLTGN